MLKALLTGLLLMPLAILAKPPPGQHLRPGPGPKRFRIHPNRERGFDREHHLRLRPKLPAQYHLLPPRPRQERAGRLGLVPGLFLYDHSPQAWYTHRDLPLLLCLYPRRAPQPNPHLAVHGLYTLTLSAYNSGDSATSVSYFKTVPPAPATPTLARPATESINQGISPTLAWNLAARAVNHRLQVSLTADFAAPLRDTVIQTDTLIALTSLANDLKHYWRIAAVNPGGSAWSETWNFTTIVALPAPMTLLLPALGDTLKADSLLAVWNSGTPKADRYWVEVSRDSAFTYAVTDTSLTDTTNALASATSARSGGSMSMPLRRAFWRTGRRCGGSMDRRCLCTPCRRPPS